MMSHWNLLNVVTVKVNEVSSLYHHSSVVSSGSLIVTGKGNLELNSFLKIMINYFKHLEYYVKFCVIRCSLFFFYVYVPCL